MLVILSVWSWLSPVLTGIVCLLIGGIVGFFLARRFFTRYLEKNPPVNEKMIRAMMTQMGRTPSEKQVRAVMKSMQENK